MLFKWGHANLDCTVDSNRARKKWRWSRVKACFSSTAELAIIIFFSSLSVCALLPVGQRFIITLMKLKVGKSQKIFHINEWNYYSTKNWRILILFIGWLIFVKLAQKQPNPSLFLINKYIFHLFCFDPLYVLGLHQKIFKYIISKFEKKSVQNENSVLVFCIMFAFVLFLLVFRL